MNTNKKEWAPTKNFFYGTLKRGHYNNERMSLNDPTVATFVGTAVVTGMTLVQPPGYPYPFAVKSEEDGAHIEGELWDIHDKDIDEWIEAMELGAGYDAIRTVTDDGETVLMYGILEDNPSHSAAELLKNRNFSNFI